MQGLIYGYPLADLDDLIEIIKHALPFIFVCHFWRDDCQQFKALFEGNYELLIGRFKDLDILEQLFVGGCHLFGYLSLRVVLLVHSFSRVHTLSDQAGTVDCNILLEAKP